MIEIKITGTTPLEALASVTAFGWHCMKDQEVHAAATRVLAAEEKKSGPAPAAPAPVAAAVPMNPAPAPVEAAPASTPAPVDPTPTPAPTPVTAAPVAGPQVTTPGNAPTAAPVAAAPTYTVEQIGKAGADLMSQNPAKMPELLALLQKYGARSIIEVKQEQLGAFATELRGLGAKL